MSKKIIVHENIRIVNSYNCRENIRGFSANETEEAVACLNTFDSVRNDYLLQLDMHLENYLHHVVKSTKFAKRKIISGLKDGVGGVTSHKIAQVEDESEEISCHAVQNMDLTTCKSIENKEQCNSKLLQSGVQNLVWNDLHINGICLPAMDIDTTSNNSVLEHCNDDTITKKIDRLNKEIEFQQNCIIETILQTFSFKDLSTHKRKVGRPLKQLERRRGRPRKTKASPDAAAKLCEIRRRRERLQGLFKRLSRATEILNTSQFNASQMSDLLTDNSHADSAFDECIDCEMKKPSTDDGQKPHILRALLEKPCQAASQCEAADKQMNNVNMSKGCEPPDRNVQSASNCFNSTLELPCTDSFSTIIINDELNLKSEEIEFSDYEYLDENNQIIDLSSIDEEKLELKYEPTKVVVDRQKINELLRAKIVTDPKKVRFDICKEVVILDRFNVRSFDFDRHCHDFNVFLVFVSFDKLPDFVYECKDIILNILMDLIQFVEVKAFCDEWRMSVR